MATKPQQIFITGESPLVEEYAALCIRRGFSVTTHPNAAKAVLPQGVRKSAAPPRSTWIGLELTNIDIDRKKKNLRNLNNTLGQSTTIITSSTTVSVAEVTTWLSHTRPLIGLGAFPTLIDGSLVELAIGKLTDRNSVDTATMFFSRLGKETAIVQDRVGLVMPRILCMLANEACFAMMEGIADSRAIDTAMKLGTSYPAGPVEWSERIGIAHVHAVVKALHTALGEDRYRVAPLLQRASIDGVFPGR